MLSVLNNLRMKENMKLDKYNEVREDLWEGKELSKMYCMKK